jgi:lysophospholipase L1-like esterase
MRHRRIRGWVPGLAGAAFVAALATFAWPEPPFPQTPVPALRLTPDATFTARLLPPQPDLIALPARLTGRIAAGEAPGSILHEWPALQAEARFQGKAVTLRLNDAVDRWRVTLDGAAVEIARPGLKDLRIEGLTDGPHVIRAERISEWHGAAEFDGLFLDPGATPLPPPELPSRLVEFIGDSDTVGFGNTAERRDCDSEQVFAATDTTQAFPARVAQELGAGYRVIARSGIGLMRNAGGEDPARTMRQLYPLALPSHPEVARLPAPKADLLVIGLGSNDFGSEFAADEPWQDNAALSLDFGPGLEEFARARLQENPGAELILLAFGEYGDALSDPYRQTAETLAGEGFAVRLAMLGKLERTACLWHPSLTDHAMIARLITDTAREAWPEWEN